ncbi:hypothetical protein BDZ97DRAFT_1916684 [Flammula alnicola]|nr:hypothetical protein BDZ97DRAFT_1916684 [Flammula alnicola]
MLLPYLTFPADATIEISCDSMHTWNEECEQSVILSTFNRRTRFKKSTAPTIRCLKLKSGDWGLSFRAWEDIDSYGEFEMQDGDPFLKFNLNDKANVPNDSIPRACRSLPLSNLETLRLGARTVVNSATWKMYLSTLKNLRSIHLGHDSLIQLLEAVSPSAYSKRKTVAFPVLQQLSAENIRFTIQKCPIWGMKQWFIERQKKKVPIRTLILTRCICLGPKDISVFKAIVQHVQWDEMTLVDDSGCSEDDRSNSDYSTDPDDG